MSTAWTGLKWYQTKSYADGGVEGNTLQALSGTAYVNTEVYARLNFFDGEVKKVYVDWDDGVNQTTEKGIYQWSSLDSPTGSVVLSHTYTATGTFAPLVRTVNQKGFISKFFGSSSTNSDVSPYEQIIRISPIRVSDNNPLAISKVENKTVRSGIDNSVFADAPKDIYLGVPPLLTTTEINAITPANLEVTVIRHIISGTTLMDDTSGGYKEIGMYTVAVNLSGGTVSTTSDSGLSSPSRTFNRQINPDDEKVHKILKVKYLNPKVSGATYNTNVGLSKLKMFICASGTQSYGNDAAGAPVDRGNIFFPITYVSAGDPIKEEDDTKRTVTLDWSQSRSAASNVKISKYLYDTGKAPYQLNNNWGVSGTSYPNDYAISGTNFTTDISGNTSTYSTQYTYMTRPDGLMSGLVRYWSGSGISQAFGLICQDINTDSFNHSVGDNWSTWNKDIDIWGYDAGGGTAGYSGYAVGGDQFLVDDYNRFMDLYHLARVQTKAESGKRSKLEHFDVMRVTPSRYLYSGAAQGTNTEMTDAQSQGRSAIVTSGAALNSLTQVYKYARPDSTISGTAGILQDWITGDNTAGGYRIGLNTLSDNSEYLLLMLDRPFNKIHFNISPYLSGGNASGTANLDADLIERFTNPIQVQASYLKITNSGSWNQTADLIPLRLKDTTRYERTLRDASNDTYVTRNSSLAKSGYISFDKPSDWSKTSFGQLVGNTGAPFGDITTGVPSYAIPWTGTVQRVTGPQGTSTIDGEVAAGFLISGTSHSANSRLLSISTSAIGANTHIYVIGDYTGGGNVGKWWWISSGTMTDGWYPTGNQYGMSNTNGMMYVRLGQQTSYDVSGTTISGNVVPINIYDAVPGFLKYDLSAYGDICNGGDNYRFMFDNASVGSGTALARNVSETWKDKYVLQLKIKGGNNRFPNASGTRGNAAMQFGAELHNLLPSDNAYSQTIRQVDSSAFNLDHLKITSNLSVNRQGNYYQAITKGGTVYIVKMGEQISTLTFSGKGMGDEVQFSYSRPNSMYGDLQQLRDLQKDNVRVYWDEKQKDGTFVRFFGIITNVSETHSVQGPRAPRSYTASMTVEEVCLLNAGGTLISDIQSLGGIRDARDFL